MIAAYEPKKKAEGPLNDPGPCDQVCSIAQTARELADDYQAAADTAQDVADTAQDLANSADSVADLAEQDCIDCLNQNS